ncbi:MAG TPA: M28 family peptidase, partial [Planctomycetota bacterium]|nr:M28 family peptidase [Planctomycetota bacterium]
PLGPCVSWPPMQPSIPRRVVFALSLVFAACAGGGRDGGWPLEAEAQAEARLIDDVAWLADDAQEGRRAGTEAGTRAALWLARRFDELGLEPAGEGGWMQEFQVPLPVRDGGGSRLEAGGVVAQGAKDLVPLFCSDGASARGPLVWGGYGISNAEAGWDDYAFARKNGALEGAVVLVVRGVPPVAGRASESDETALVQTGDGWGNSGSLFTKVMTAKRLGAAAVLVAPHPAAGAGALKAFDATRSAQSSIPCAMVSLQLARKLEPAYDAMVARLDRGEGPAAFRAQTAPQVDVACDVRRERGPAFNVLARLPGARPDRAIVIGAHYDHLGHGGDGSLAPDAVGQVHNGADDNASGTAAVLEIARRLKAGPRPGCDVVFALWSGEELGLLGSEHWAQHPTIALERVAANLNLDMVGRAGDGKLAVLGVGTAEPFERWLLADGGRAGLDLALSSSGQGVGGSDHQTFLKRKIPALHFFSGVHPDYHKPTDDVERFEADGTLRVVELVQRLTLEAAAAPALALAYVEPPPSEGEAQAESRRLGAGWRVWFGSVPEYGYDGRGLLLSGTSEGSPAERAGLLAGDVITRVGEIEVETIYDFMHALQTYKPGDVVATRFERDGAVQEVRVTLATRDAQ